MTKLLVSVRDAGEAAAALRAGVDLLDVKEPARGSLGAADSSTIASVIQTVSQRAPVSAALGELHETAPSDFAQLPVGLSYAKVGLARCGKRADWAIDWADALRRLPRGVASVAVVYADWREADAPSPDDVLRQGAALGCRAALLDTFHKNGQGLLDHWTLSETADFVAAAREVGMLTVLAGSLTPEAIDRLRPLEPDYVAVRGAVCDGARDGTLVEGKVAALAARMHGPSVSSA